MKNIYITGILSGIGSTLGYFLYKKGFNVYGCDNYSSENSNNNLIVNGEKYAKKIENLDILHNPVLTMDLIDKKIDVIIHLAAITSLPECEENPKKCFDINTMGTVSVLEAARKAGIKTVVFASTSAIYEGLPDWMTPFEEVLGFQPPILAYPLSKFLAEQCCYSYRKKYNIRIPILRYFNVFGPRQDIHRQSPPLINYIVKKILNNEVPVFHSDGNQKRDYVHVDDVCNATYQVLIQENANSEYNVCSGKLLSVNDIYSIICKTLNFDKPAQFNPSDKLWSNYDIQIDPNLIIKETNKFSLGSNKKIKKELGVSINENLEELVSQTAKEISLLYKEKIK